MPTYDYKCADCGRVFEKFHGMNEKPSVVCPECSSANTGKQLSVGAGIVFKGAGFYVNDYKKEGGKSVASRATSSTVKGAVGDAKTSETKSSDVKSSESAPAASTGHVHGPGCNHG